MGLLFTVSPLAQGENIISEGHQQHVSKVSPTIVRILVTMLAYYGFLTSYLPVR